MAHRLLKTLERFADRSSSDGVKWVVSYRRAALLAQLLIPIVFVTSCGHEPPPWTLKAYAEKATRQGLREIFFVEAPEAVGSGGSLDSLLAHFSVVVATASRPKALVLPHVSSISTWNVFDDVEVLSHRPVPSNIDCPPSPAGLKLEAGDVAIPVGGGTVVVDGVAITIRYTGMMPRKSARYLFLAVECSESVVAAPLYGDEAFELRDSRLVSTTGARFGYQREMEALGTIDGVKKYLASMR